MDMHHVIADGQLWIDSDGKDAWPFIEAETLASSLDLIGYETDVVPA